MSERPAPLDLSSAEMLVLFDWLSRSSEAGAPVADLDEAEQRVLWDLESALESRLAAPLDEHYEERLQQARDQVLGRG